MAPCQGHRKWNVWNHVNAEYFIHNLLCNLQGRPASVPIYRWRQCTMHNLGARLFNGLIAPIKLNYNFVKLWIFYIIIFRHLICNANNVITLRLYLTLVYSGMTPQKIFRPGEAKHFTSRISTFSRQLILLYNFLLLNSPFFYHRARIPDWGCLERENFLCLLCLYLDMILAVLRKRNASIKKCHKNAKIYFTKAQEKEYGNAWHNCTKAHNTR